MHRLIQGHLEKPVLYYELEDGLHTVGFCIFGKILEEIVEHCTLALIRCSPTGWPT